MDRAASTTSLLHPSPQHPPCRGWPAITGGVANSTISLTALAERGVWSRAQGRWKDNSQGWDGLVGIPFESSGAVGFAACIPPFPITLRCKPPSLVFLKCFSLPCVSPGKVSIRARQFGVKLAAKVQVIEALNSRSAWSVFRGLFGGLQSTTWYHCTSKMQW